MNEVIVSSFIISIDSVQNSIDLNNFIDYMKNNYKKEITIINANEFADPGGRALKTDNKTEKKSKIDFNNIIAKSIKQKIDSDLLKVLENKKKQIAAAEKAKIQASIGKPAKNKTKPIDGKQYIPFENIIDVLYIILNFPYLPNQLNELINSGIDFGGFITFIPSNGVEYNSFERKSPEKSTRQIPKKSLIPGFELDTSLNINIFPPPRWDVLKPISNPLISFIEIPGDIDFEKLFLEFEENIIQIIQSKEPFNNLIGNRKIINLPSIKPNLSHEIYNEYLTEHPEDYINAIYTQLRENNFQVSIPKPPLTSQDIYNNIFSKILDSLSRKVVYYEKKEPYDPFFNFDIPYSVYPYLYNLYKWNLKPENAKTCLSLSEFLTLPHNLYAYCGNKFDQMISNITKKKQIPLPQSFFDWSSWNSSIEYNNIFEELQDSLSSNNIIESFIDEQIGLLFFLTLSPVTRNNGYMTSNQFIPLTIENISDYIKSFNEKSNNQNEKKTRTILTPQQIIKDNLNPNILIQNVQTQFSNNNNSNIYKLPISICRHNNLTTNYLFDSNIKIEIHRDIIEEKLNFGYSLFCNNLFAVYGDTNRVVISLVEGLKITYEDSFNTSILFIEQSIFYDGSKLILKSSNETPIIILEDGTFLANNDQNNPFIVYPDGSISHYKNNNWIIVKANGDTFQKNNENLTKIDFPTIKLSDFRNKIENIIRYDEIEYLIKSDGSRKILFKIDYYIEQQNEKTFYDIPQFPFIQVTNKKKTMTINRFDILLEGKYLELSCEDYKIIIKEKDIKIITKNQEIRLNCNKIEMKSNNTIFISDINGNECIGNLITENLPKKKVELINTSFGQIINSKENLNENQIINLHKLFKPRFFVIRSDFSATEYLRKDTIDMTDLVEKENSLLHSSGSECEIFTHHSKNIDIPPKIYIKHQSLNKSERTNLLKSIQIPKQTKNKKNILNQNDINTGYLEAEGSRQSLFYDLKVFSQALDSYLDRAHEQFLEEIHPIEITEQNKLILPPQTPIPRVLEMQFKKYISKEINNINYWNSPESTFSFLEEISFNHLNRSNNLTKSFIDPPLNYEHEKIEFEIINSPKIPKSINSYSPRSIKTIQRPQTLSANPHSIIFGNVKEGTTAKVSIFVTNTGNKPLHYTVTQPNHHLLKVLTPPGVVYPGFKMKLEVKLEKGEPQEIESTFLLKTSTFSMSIPVSATIF